VVKINGPIQSLRASGTIAHAVTVSNWKGRHYLKRHPTPADPKSDQQIAQRNLVSFLSTAWSGLTVNQKASWNQLATRHRLPAYNAFLAENLRRLDILKGPTKTYPAAEVGVVPAIGKYEPACSSAIHSIEVVLSFTPQNDVWGWLLVSYTGIPKPTNIDQLVYMATAVATPSTNKITVQRPLGLWQNMARLFSDDGVMGPFKNQQAATSLPS